MTPKQAIVTGYSQSFQFHGRASRSEFWWFAPVASALAFATVITFRAVTDFLYLYELSFNTLSIVFLGLLHIPVATVLIRRLRDTGLHWRLLWVPIQMVAIFCVSYVIRFILIIAQTMGVQRGPVWENTTLILLYAVVAMPLVVALLRPSMPIPPTAPTA